MIERTLTRLAAVALGLAASLSGAARADFIPIAMPDAAYVGGTSSLGVSAADFDVVSSLSDGIQTASFDIGMVALTVPTSWGSWGSPPNTESATPRVLWTNGLTMLTITLGLPSFTFGFEAQPNTIVPSDLTVDFFSLGTLVGSILLNVDGNAGARLFAAKTTTDAFDTVVISGLDDFGIANLRYAAIVIPEPGTVALVVAGLLLLGLARRKRAG